MSFEEKAYNPGHHIRVVTATSLFDGHDASINIMRRILQDTGAEVIHLGHNRSVQEIVTAAVEEDVQGIAVSSYQGGHVEFFKYMVDLLKKNEASHIKVFGGGGGGLFYRKKYRNWKPMVSPKYIRPKMAPAGDFRESSTIS